MKTAEIIKAAGFKTKRFNTEIYKGAFGGNCNHVIILLNANNEVLCYEDKIYTPVGRNNAFASLILSNDINASCFNFKKLA